MNKLLRPAALVAALAVPLVVPLVLAGGAYAGDEKKPADEKAAAPAWNVPHEACFGDRYETDADLNEGNTVSIDEILALINPPRT